MMACTIPAGHLADRFDRRLILVISYLVSALAAGGFLTLALTGTVVIWPATVIPPPGAVCPAMVKNELVMTSGDDKLIVPEMSNTTVRLFVVELTAARKLPAPESFRLMT